jgi:hypothetical protein
VEMREKESRTYAPEAYPLALSLRAQRSNLQRNEASSGDCRVGLRTPRNDSERWQPSCQPEHPILQFNRLHSYFKFAEAVTVIGSPEALPSLHSHGQDDELKSGNHTPRRTMTPMFGITWLGSRSAARTPSRMSTLSTSTTYPASRIRLVASMREYALTPNRRPNRPGSTIQNVLSKHWSSDTSGLRFSLNPRRGRASSRC